MFMKTIAFKRNPLIIHVLKLAATLQLKLSFLRESFREKTLNTNFDMREEIILFFISNIVDEIVSIVIKNSTT